MVQAYVPHYPTLPFHPLLPSIGTNSNNDQTGAAIARKFASAYPVVLLARNPDNYISLVDSINDSGGKAMGISTDVSDSKSIKGMLEKVKREHGYDVKCAAAVFNASGAFVRKPFLELTEEILDASYAGSV